ncbi:MAG TPA: hypothetical protein VE398_13535 [Acidobacteriota bacterium]|nr:hypothetical protein [Acidobacteriota bacterium]
MKSANVVSLLLARRAELHALGKVLIAQIAAAGETDAGASIIRMDEILRKQKGGHLRARGRLAQHEEIRILYRVLRACILGDRDVPWFKDELRILEKAVNQPATLRSEACSESGPYFVAILNPLLRSAVQTMTRYTKLLASNPELIPCAPIGVCPLCDALYLRSKSDQEYCSPKCRVSRWANEKGKAYFARKQREHRARKIGMVAANHQKPSDKLRKIIREKQRKREKG